MRIEVVRQSTSYKYVKTILACIWLAAVFGFLFLYLAKNWINVSNYAWDLNYFWLFFAFLMAMLRRLSAAARWALILNYADSNTLLPRNTAFLQPFFYSNLANYIPGSIWGYASRVELARRQGVPVRQSSFSILYEMMLSVILGLAIGSYALLSLTSLEHSFTVILAIGIILLTVLLVGSKPWNYLFRLRSGLLTKHIPTIPENTKKNFLIWMVSINNLILGGLSFFCIVKSVHMELPWLEFFYLTSVSALAWSAGFLAVWTPSGIGVREGVAIGLLLNSIPQVVLLAVVIVDRLMLLLVDVTWAGFAAIKTSYSTASET